MKKYLYIFLTVVIALFSIVFVGCDDEHEHRYGEWEIVVAATCVKDGLKERKCDCGDTVTRVIPALGHNFVNGVCTDCGVKR